MADHTDVGPQSIEISCSEKLLYLSRITEVKNLVTDRGSFVHVYHATRTSFFFKVYKTLPFFLYLGILILLFFSSPFFALFLVSCATITYLQFYQYDKRCIDLLRRYRSPARNVVDIERILLQALQRSSDCRLI